MSEGDRRRKNIIWLAAAMLIGFFLPVWMPESESRFDNISGVCIPNIHLLLDRSIDFQAAFLLAYPFFAAWTVIILAQLPRLGVRAVGLIVLGVLPFVVIFGNREGMAGLQDAMHHLSASQGAFERLLQLGVMSMLAWIGLFVGIRARWYRPSSEVAHAFGVAGAGLFLACLIVSLVPMTDGYYHRYGAPSFSDIVTRPDLLLMTLGSFASWCCMAFASVLCLLNSARNDAQKARRRTGLAFKSFLIAHAVLLGVGLLFLVFAIFAPDSTGMEAVATVMMVKGILLVGPVLLLIPLGLTDLVAGKGEPAEAEPPLATALPDEPPPA